MFSTILVPVDGSDQALMAVDFAVDLSVRFDNAKILLLSVFRHHSPMEGSLSMVRPLHPKTPDEALREYAKGLVAAARAHALEKGAPNVEAYAKRGQPARAIIDFAKEHTCDVIVMGARGTGDVESFLLGSVSHKVSGLSPVTCILVK
ncbi:universal stress protein [Roseospira marina]|uniref:Universal stress protein n=1 Tax=Roseospira marina TaxID=140057 RepID=A0A5M6I8M9_9PROT|nr:universal stress protein [Roseospira marina]KAA5604109.1 universal stress protein [Roseospira marina]MBB4315790.1 nucleotide-binding universal stress UspA family protein [Roseospira marina]MBB5088971.1 nucleotide-binding universal stress UspA family protein [Roseospira marina]